MTKFEIQPIDSRASFYGKCYVIEGANTFTLYSYDTMIVEINKNTYSATNRIDESLLSATTLRHLKAFLEFTGAVINGSKLTKQEIIKKYC